MHKLYVFSLLALACCTSAFQLVPVPNVRSHANSQEARSQLSLPIRTRSSSSGLLRFEKSLPAQADPTQELVGEDAAVFEFSNQKIQSWGIFSVLVTSVLGLLYVTWIKADTGFGDDYIRLLESIAGGDSHVVMGMLLTIFGVIHSGLASLRTKGESIIGARAWRVLFALASLPLALSAVVYFINHRYDGALLWSLRDFPGMHGLCWALSFVSFLFLYPSTFNLLEVAAVDRPEQHLWETGVARVTRHPQAVGQGLWCLAHTLWVGTSFMCVATAGLMAHHLFACWHGDRRLEERHGDAFRRVKERTSIMPFQAILEGRQQLPQDYYKEFLRGPYLIVTVATVGAYFAHPYMQAYSYLTQW
mmetsp:Transcript_10757/g.16662  ORF Transcript_10757/g.16662 Transcript_10757/m.16662 type:complete len:361 (-) Transcript_10757:215-1297(-)